LIHDFSRICFVFFSGKLANPLQGLEHAFESAGRKTDMIEYAPQERVLSRFACMLESSANGRAWIDFDLASYCDSCADKVTSLLKSSSNKINLDVFMPTQICRSIDNRSYTGWNEVHSNISTSFEIQRSLNSVD